MHCCRQDVLILKPDRPFTIISRLVANWARHNDVSQGGVYSTQTTL